MSLSEIRVNTLKTRTGVGTITYTETGPIIAGIVTATGLNISGNASIGGVLTYEDVTNIDSVGLITARSGVNVTGGSVIIGQGGSGANNAELKLRAGAGTGNDIIAFLNQGGTTRGNITYDTDNNFLLFNVNADERARIDSSGRILSGHDASIDQNAQIQSWTSGTDTFAGFKYGNNAAPNIIRLGKSRNASAGGNTIVANDDEIGRLLFSGNDGSQFRDAAYISGFVDGTPSTGTDMPGRLSFFTSPDGSLPSLERVRITSGGLVGMGLVDSGGTGCDPDGNALLIRAATTVGTTKGHIMLTGDSATNGQGPQIVFSESGGGSNFAGAYIGHVRTTTNSVGDLVFGTRATGGDANTVPTERLRIDSAGMSKFTRGSGGTVAHFYANARECNILLQNDAQTWKIVNYDYGNNGTDNLGFHDGTADRLVIAKTAKIGINNTNPDYTLDVRTPSGDVWVSARGGTNQGYMVRKSDNTLIGYAGNGGGVNLGANDFAISAPAANLSLCTGGTAASNERLKITSGGQVQITSGSLRVTDSGNSTANSTHTTGALRCNLIRSDTSNNNAYTGTYFMNVNAAGGGIKSVGIVETGLKVGDFTSNLAAAEKIKLTYDGHVEIKTDGGRLKIGAGNDLQMYHDDGGGMNHITCANNHHLKLSAQTFKVYDYTGNTQYFTVQSDKVMVHKDLKASANNTLDIGANGAKFRRAFANYFVHRTGSSSGVGQNEAEAIYVSGGLHFFHDHVTLSTSNFTHGLVSNRSYDLFRLRNSGSGSAIYAENGSISSGSDYRMKENIAPITGAIDMVKNLKPCTYNIKKSFNEHDAGGTHQGFIAHEVQEAIPNIVNIVQGTKDAMEEVRYMEEDENIPSGKKPGDGTGVFTDKPDMQGIDYGHMTPILAAALKEAIAKIEILEAEVAALKSS